PLSIATAVLGGTNAGDFALASGTTCINGATLAAGANCVLNLTFTPTAASARTATVTITDHAAGSPQSVSPTGTGVTPPTATLSATSSAFGEQRVGTTSAAQNVTLTNNGGAPRTSPASPSPERGLPTLPSPPAIPAPPGLVQW